MLKIFISWSGEPSRSIAGSLSGWLGLVAQHVSPWISDDMQSGTRWNDALAHALDASDYGLVCVTRSNQLAPWLMFEAGALAKRFGTARVVPLCIDLAPSDIVSPLQAFQARMLDKDGLRRLVHDLWDLADVPKAREDIDRLFEAMWPIMADAIGAAPTREGAGEPPERTAEDMLAEVITRLRGLELANDGFAMENSRLGDVVELLNRSTRELKYLTPFLERFAESVSHLRSVVVDGIPGSMEYGGLLERRIDGQVMPDFLAVGDRIVHDRFGRGLVSAVFGEGKEQQSILAIFDDGRKRRFSTRNAPIRKEKPSD